LENLGKYFLDLRLKHDLSYKKVWEDIRLREDLVKSLQGNRIFELGPYGVAKALVYNYARYLEADLDAVMREFAIMMPETTKNPFSPRKTLKEKKIMLSTNFLWMVGIILFSIFLGSILIHAYNQGWLKAPDFFSATKPDSTAVDLHEAKEEVKPDTLRQRMRILSENISQANSTTTSKNAANPAIPDTTDYIGNILGDSPVNVPLH